MASATLFALVALSIYSAGVLAQKCRPDVEQLLAGIPEEAGGSRTLYGAPTNYSQGVIQTYSRFRDCELEAVGMEFSTSILDNLPGVSEVSNQPPKGCERDYDQPGCFHPVDQILLPTFQKAGNYNAFQVAEWDWEPTGHALKGVYTVPHFDFHFYLVSEDEVKAVVPGNCSGVAPQVFTQLNQPMPEQCFPGANFSNNGLVAPFMGNHYIDAVNAPEFQALRAGENALAAWNSTWIWGGDKGKISFFEVMVRRGYLADGGPGDTWASCEEIPGMPDEFAVAGPKPSTYCVIKGEDTIRVELNDFSWYPAGCESGPMAPQSYLHLPPGAPPPAPGCAYPTA